MLRSAATPNRTEVQPRPEMKRITTRPPSTAPADAERLPYVLTHAQINVLNAAAIRLFEA